MKIEHYGRHRAYCGIATLVLLFFLSALWLNLCQSLRSTGFSTGPTVGMVLPRSVDTWNDNLRNDLAAAVRERGFFVKTVETDMKLSEQITAMRSFILNEACCIILDPVTSFGWDDILSEAAQAGIPVVTVNHRLISSPELVAENLYQVSYHYQEAAERLALAYLHARDSDSDDPSLILTGNISSEFSKTINAGLRAGFVRAGAALHAYNSPCNEMQSKAGENLRSLIRNDNTFQVVFSHNSAMALGCIQAFQQYGIVPGTDIHIYAFGGGADLDAALAAGSLSGYAACDTQTLASTAAEIASLLSANTAPAAHDYQVPCQLMLREE